MNVVCSGEYHATRETYMSFMIATVCFSAVLWVPLRRQYEFQNFVAFFLFFGGGRGVFFVVRDSPGKVHTKSWTYFNITPGLFLKKNKK